MKEIDIERLSKAMPYKPLEERYFEQLPYKSLEKMAILIEDEHITAEPQQRWSFVHTLRTMAAASVAAAVLVGAMFLFHDNSPSGDEAYEQQIKEFVETLSDRDLELIINESEANYEFYTNL